MEKILKKILFLIPVLIVVSFTCPLLVFAEETTDIKCTWNSCSLSSAQNNYLVSSFNYCSDNAYNFYYSDGQSIQKTIILYNTELDFYVNLFWFRNFSPDNELVYSNLNFDSTTSFFKRYDTNQSLGVQPYAYFYSKNDISSILTSDVGYSSSSIKTLILNDSYFYAHLQGDSYFPQYYSNNLSDFVLVSDSSYSGYYIDGVEQLVQNVCFSPEESEPEEPEPEEPVINNNLDMVYIPNYKKGQCIEVIDKDTLRVFENENSISFIDYFVNSHYLSKTGQVEVSYQKNCSNLNFTSIGYYRNDFPEILLIIGSLSLFSIGFIYILFKRFRKR